MSEVEIKKSNRIFTASLWIIPLVFYLVFWFIDGAVWCADSDSYVKMHACREPLYPTLLALLRFICGVGEGADPENNISLLVMAFIQSLLAAVAAGSLTVYLVRRFYPEALFGNTLYGRKMCTDVGKAECVEHGRKQRFYAYVLLAVPLSVSLLNRFLAGRASMYSNSIMTEGIAISIYLLAFRFILEYMSEGTGYSFVMTCLCVLTGISVRKQMYVLLCLLLIAVIYKSRSFWGGALKLILTTAVIVGMAILFDCTFNMVVRDSFIIHTEDNRFVTTMAMYTSEREYSGFVEPEFRDIYLKIYDECDKNGWLMHDAPSGWNDAVSHFADNYDHIQLDTMQLMLEDFVDETTYAGFLDGMTKTEKVDVVRASLNKSLIPHESDRLLKVFAYNFLNGMVNTVAKKNMVLCIYSIVIYVIYAALLLRCIALYFRYKKKPDIYEGPDPVYMRKLYGAKILFGIMTLISILGNVTLVSAVIFCQTRYTIYNMPLFYMALIIIFGERRRIKNV